jgi:hypothetical protein
MTIEQALKQLDRLVGSWVTEATHPAFPGLVVHGTVEVEWLEGKRFLIHRARVDHADFPDSISIIGNVERDRAEPRNAGSDDAQLSMHYFDSRGVFREYQAGSDDAAWRIWRDSPDFSQRFTGTFSSDGDTIVGVWEVCEDGVHWKKDLAITYRR